MCWASKNKKWRRRAGLAAALLPFLFTVLPLAAKAQNNTGYPSGTKCSDLIGPRRSACVDSFDPRPNPREIINKPPSKAVSPPKAPPLGQDAFPTNPKVPHSVPPPIIKKQHK
jgi:hypothetical protein